MTSLTDIIADIRKAMEGATPGPWHPGCIVDDASSCNCRSICDEGYAGGIATVHLGNGLPIDKGGNDAPPFDECKANTAYIAACNPSNIAVVLDALEKAERARDEAILRLKTYEQVDYEVNAEFVAISDRRAEAAEAALKESVELLKPFARLGDIVLAEAPPEASFLSVFKSCTGDWHAIEFDDLRAARRFIEAHTGGEDAK